MARSNRLIVVTRIVLATFVMSLTGISVWVKDCEGASERVPNKPNVILVLTDDQGWGDVGSHGNTTLDTPVMDRFAEEGARFDRFFVSPVCAPTRASLLTGRYHLRTGTNGVTRGRENMRTEEVTIAEILKKSAYVTREIVLLAGKRLNAGRELMTTGWLVWK